MDLLDSAAASAAVGDDAVASAQGPAAHGLGGLVASPVSDIEAMVEMRRSGVTFAGIARHFRIGADEARYLVTKAGGYVDAARVWTPERIEQLRELAARRPVLSYLEIAYIMGLPHKGVKDRAHRLGIVKPKYRNPPELARAIALAHRYESVPAAHVYDPKHEAKIMAGVSYEDDPRAVYAGSKGRSPCRPQTHVPTQSSAA